MRRPTATRCCARRSSPTASPISSLPRRRSTPAAMEPVSVLATYPLILIVKRGPGRPTTCRTCIAYAKANPGQAQLRAPGQRQYRPSARRAADAQGQLPHDGDSLSRQRAGHQRSARRQYRSRARTICSPTSRTSMPASSSSWPPAAASGSRTIPTSRPSPRRLPGVYADTWMAVAAPPGTPKEIAKKISDAIGQGFKRPTARAHPGARGRAARQHARRRCAT